MIWIVLGCTSNAGYRAEGPSADVPPMDTAIGAHAGGVVVVGGGPSGLAVAMDVEQPARLFEASERLGGRAPGAGQLMYFVGTEEQAAHHVEDSVEQALEDWPLYTGAEATETTRAFLEDSDGVRDRLVELGLDFRLSGPDFPLRRHRNHGAELPGLPLVLEEALPEEVEVALETPVTGLLIEDGRVLGVRTAEGPVLAGTVVIASGGFASRVDLLDGAVRWDAGRWAPSPDEGAWGDALDWAEQHGLGVSDLDDMGAKVNAVGLPGEDGLAVMLSDEGPAEWLLLDADGQRIVDESQTFSTIVAAAVQENEPVWQVMTEDSLYARLPEEADAVLERVACADEPQDLALTIAMDPKGMQDTFDALLPNERSLVSGRLCAFPPGFTATKGFGGLDVDERQRVLDQHGEPVLGLYAVGEAAGMAAPGMGGRYGFDGSLSAVVWSGWRAAEAINEEASWN